MEYLEDIGLLKMDFLGLKNLTTIANILKLINKPNLNDIDLEKKEVYKMFCAGKTEGIFQLETKMMQDLCMKLKPNCFNDLIDYKNQLVSKYIFNPPFPKFLPPTYKWAEWW